MCTRRAKKTHDFIALRVFSNIDAASLPQNVYYRVIAVREGGHALETVSYTHLTLPTTPYV